MQPEGGRPRVYAWYQDQLAPRLEVILKEVGYEGPLGIDALVYRDPEGTYKLKSVVEINPRFTMGRVAHELSQHVAPGALGLFQIVSRKQIQKVFGQSPEDYVRTVEDSVETQVKGESPAKMTHASFVLTDASKAERFLALYHVRRSVEEIETLLSQF